LFVQMTLGLSTVLVSLITVILGFRQFKTEQRFKMEQVRIEDDAKSKQFSSDSNSRLVDQLQEEVTRLSSDLAQARAEIREVYSQFRSLRTKLLDFELGIKILTMQLLENGQAPHWTITPDDHTLPLDDLFGPHDPLKDGPS
jgi:uncharacterized protein YlxW (UPF0749 family)